MLTPAGNSSLRSSIYQNPVVDADFPDAAHWRTADGRHYLIATPTDGRNMQLAVSTDGTHFTLLEQGAFAKLPSWMNLPRNFWAPDVQRVGDELRLYFTTDSKKSGHMGIMLAISRNDEPFAIEAGRDDFIVEGPSFTTIDPFVFNFNERAHLGWGSGHSPIWMQELAEDGYHFASGSHPHRLIEPAKGRYTSLLEAGGMTFSEKTGKYLLITSGDNTWVRGRYAMLAHMAASPFGPYASSRKGKPILKGNSRFWSPAQGWFFKDDAGDSWCYYLAVDAKNPYIRDRKEDPHAPFRRVTCLDRVIEDEEGYPIINDGTPSTAKQTGPRWLV